jgi:hypothetical protein
MSRAQGCVGPALRGATTYRITLGPQAGRKVLTLQTLPACEPDDYADTAGQWDHHARVRHRRVFRRWVLPAPCVFHTRRHYGYRCRSPGKQA